MLYYSYDQCNLFCINSNSVTKNYVAGNLLEFARDYRTALKLSDSFTAIYTYYPQMLYED